MIRLFAGVMLLACLAAPAFAGLDAAAVNNAEFKGKLPADDKINPVIVKAQVLLDRANFSPGEIDGKLGENAEKALKAFAEAKGLAVGKQPLTSEIWGALLATGSDPVVVDYKITEKDVKGPFLKKLPAKMEDLKGLKSLDYTSPREAIAERFHMSEALLEALNPGKKFDEAGQTIAVVNVADQREQVSRDACRSRQDVPDRQGLREFRRTDRVLSRRAWEARRSRRPSGVLKVTSIDAQPNYRYNPDYKFKGVKSKEAFTIKPGPNNPVGSHWIGLSVGGIWHSRHAEPIESQQVGVARLRAPDQLGRRQAGEAAEEGRRGRLYRARSGQQEVMSCLARPNKVRFAARPAD